MNNPATICNKVVRGLFLFFFCCYYDIILSRIKLLSRKLFTLNNVKVLRRHFPSTRSWEFNVLWPKFLLYACIHIQWCFSAILEIHVTSQYCTIAIFSHSAVLVDPGFLYPFLYFPQMVVLCNVFTPVGMIMLE